MVVNANAGMTAWDVTWETNGDTSDVKSDMLLESSWTNAGDMPSTCVDAADEASVSAPMSDVVGKKFYFTAVPVDAWVTMIHSFLYDVNYERSTDGTVTLGPPRDQSVQKEMSRPGHGAQSLVL